MNSTRRAFLAATGAMLAPAIVRAQPAAGLLTSTDADRTERLRAAARAEGGRVTLYASIAQRDVQPLSEAFQRQTGLTLTVWRASGDTVLQRVVQEIGAGRLEVDAVHVGAIEMEHLHRQRLLQPVVSPHFGALVEGAVPQHREWISTLLSVWVQAHNTNEIQRDTLPRAYADLLNPRWRGKLGIEVENVAWFATVVKQMGETEGLAFFRELVRTNGISVRRGHSLLNDMVISGEVPLALTVYNYMPAQARARGAPIDWFAIPPAIARANAMGITRTSRNPAASALFVDFMLSEGQRILAELDYVPVRREVANPIQSIPLRLIDIATAVDEQRRWQPLFQEIIVRGSR